MNLPFPKIHHRDCTPPSPGIEVCGAPTIPPIFREDSSMTEEAPKKPGTTKVLKEFFGMRPGTKLADFAAELKELSDVEKEQLAEGISNGSLNY